MGNVAKCLCHQEEDLEPRHFWPSRTKPKIHKQDEKAKLKAASCTIPPILRLTSSDSASTVVEGPSIDQFTLYSVVVVQEDLGHRGVRQSLPRQAQRQRPILCNKGREEISSPSSAFSIATRLDGKGDPISVSELLYRPPHLNLPRRN